MKDYIIISGSNGYIGSKLARLFRERYFVVGLDLQPPTGPNGVNLFIETDFSISTSIHSAVRQIGRILQGNRIASVLHLAAYYDFSGVPSPLYEQITVRGTETFLTSLKALPVDQFVFSSSMLVYRPCEPGQKIHEESPLEPKWDYPKSKVDAEKVILESCGAIPVVLLRIAGVYDDSCHSIPIANQIQRIFEKKIISHVYPGDTARGQSFIHLEDLVRAFDRVVEKRGELTQESG